MTDDTRLDARVRGALAELPMPDDNATREALNAVLARSSRPRREPRAWIVPGLVAAAVLALAAAGGLAGGPALDDRADTASTTDRQHRRRLAAPGDGSRQRGLERPLADGAVRRRRPDDPGARDGDQCGRRRVLHRHRRPVPYRVFVNSACPEQAAGVYEWRTGGSTLTLTLVEDPCAARIDVFAGTWRRVP